MTRREALRKTATITGFAVTSSAAIGILNRCTPSGEPGWKTKFLGNDQVDLVSSMTETILPKTDTPGAIELHIPEFVDLMLADNYTKSEQDRFLTGLKDFQERTRSKNNRKFEKCTPEDKSSLIEEEENHSYENFWQTHQMSFYLMLKELTLLGYFTSDYVMNNMLDYHPVPGRYEGCIPFNKDGKLYVDNNIL